jgi:hypothetical protein
MCSVGRIERLVRQRAQRDMHVLAVAHDREQERPADAAARVVVLLVAPHEQLAGALDDLELRALNARETERDPFRPHASAGRPRLHSDGAIAAHADRSA